MNTEEFNADMQGVLLSYMIGNKDMFTRSKTILNPDYFESNLRPAVRYILDYSDKFNDIPNPMMVRAATQVTVEPFDGFTPQSDQWFLDTIQSFARRKALELIILDGPTMIAKNEYGDLDKRVRDALTISLNQDLGTDYFDDPKTRLERLKDRSDYVSTGWASFDNRLYGGFTKGGLNVFAGGSGSGKSLFLQNIALNWCFAGLNVIYFSLELSEDLVAMRLDAMVAGVGTKEILKDVDNVALKVKLKGKKTGSLTIKKLPEAGTNANTLRAYLKEYEIKTGKKPDAIVVDYLDLMHPNNSKINPSDLFVKDKYTSEEMRALAGEYKMLCATASQLNRASVEAQEFDHSHIAGGISKINTADNVFGIFTSSSMREQGRYRLQFLKTRSSSAVGSQIELKFCPITLRIMDSEDEAGANELKPKSAEEIKAEMRQKVAAQNAVAATANTPAEAPAEVAPRNDVMALMAKIKKKNDT